MDIEMTPAQPFDDSFRSAKHLDLAPGAHVLICRNPDGAMSLPFTLTIP